jgi:hypothetical protein
MDWLKVSLVVIIGFHFSVACILGLIWIIKEIIIHYEEYGFAVLNIIVSAMLSIALWGGIAIMITTLK